MMLDADWDIDLEDSWNYKWNSNTYSSKKGYSELQETLSTRNMLRRKKNMLLEDYTCVLCNTGSEESCFHLFLECPFSVDCWNTLNISWDTSLQPLDMLIEARTSFGSPIFREIMITACWSIWKTRNAIIFYSEHHSIISWKIRFFLRKGKSDLKRSLVSCVSKPSIV